MSITKPHHLIPSLSIFIALFMISVAKTSSSIETFEFVEYILGAKKGDDTIKGLDEVRQYLIKYGYMNSISSSKVQRDDLDDILAQAVKKYQLFSHLDASGVLDAKTLAQMVLPRCGTPDFINSSTVVPHGMTLVRNMSTNRSYYSFLPSKWDRFTLTWDLKPGTRADADLPIEIAFGLWASVSKFKFIKSRMFETSDIKISFVKGDHGDGLPFGCRILAHAFPPPEGILHFNSDKNWKDGRSWTAYDIGTIGLHEIGHLLGLGHSNVKSSIMWPYARQGKIKGLHQDDIDGIRALYPS